MSNRIELLFLQLVEPYAVVSLRRDLNPHRQSSPRDHRPQSYQNSNVPTQRVLDFSSSRNFAGDRRQSADQTAGMQRLTAGASSPVRQRSSVGNIRESPRSSCSRSSIDVNSQKVRLTAQHFTGDQAEMHQSPSCLSRPSTRSSQHQSAANSPKHQSATNSQYQPAVKTRDEMRQSAQHRERLSAVVINSSESSDDCDTAPSTISSREDNKSSTGSRDSLSPPPQDKEYVHHLSIIFLNQLIKKQTSKT